MIINIRNVKGSIHSLVFLNLDAKTMYNNNPETEIKFRELIIAQITPRKSRAT